MIDTALAIGTDYRSADISADGDDLRAMAALVRGLRPDEVVAVRCNDLPSVIWPCRIGWLDLALTAPVSLHALAAGDRLRIEMGPMGAEALASTFDEVARGLLGDPGYHDHLDYYDDGSSPEVAARSLPLMVSGPTAGDAFDAVLEAGLRNLLDDDHERHPFVAGELGRLLTDREDRSHYAGEVVLRALLTDDEPSCQLAGLRLLERVLTPRALPWLYAESALDRLLALLDAEPDAANQRLIARILDRWTAPVPRTAPT